MAAFKEFLIAYIIGGVTFLPLVVALILTYSYLRLPRSESYVKTQADTNEEDYNIDEEQLDEVSKLNCRSGEPEVAAGYFAVCREYVINGINGKPPERTTPAGETIAAESPSVYQNMYRTIFDRSKNQGPSLEAGRPVKKARNVFYVVLRHGHLLLFDNIDQLEVRHVVPLAHHQIDLYGGDETLAEGELFIKRNCIRLSRKHTENEARNLSLPYFLFSDNCSEKEDFYHALLHAQEKLLEEPERPPSCLKFDTEDMIKLVRQLHATEETVQTRWLNALVGRLFLASYKTPKLQEVVRHKISKKMARLSKSAFLTSFSLDSIDLGHSAPIISNPKLREMTVDGALTIETDIKYTGEFKLVIAAIARLELGSRFRAREVNLVLAGILRKLSGHLLVRVKPPPSNRIWITFETMPKMDMIIEPVVSSRQITYGLILRAIESRIKEIMCETIVLPNWDDVPFTNTASNHFRGGIWEHPTVSINGQNLTKEDENSAKNEGSNFENVSSAHLPVPSEIREPEETNTGELVVNINAANEFEHLTPVQITVDDSVMDKSSSTSSERKPPPKAMRSNSFAAVAQPVVTTGLATGDATRQKTPRSRKMAERTMRVLSERSNEPLASASPNIPASTPQLQPNLNMDILPLSGEELSSQIYESPRILDAPLASQSTPTLNTENSAFQSGPETSPRLVPIAPGEAEISPSPTPKDTFYQKKTILNQSISSATIAAKKWGLGVLSRQNEGNDAKSIKNLRNNSEAVNQPLGRGQPLPPPGVPLPGPERRGLAASTFQSLRRKPVPGLSTLPSTRNIEDTAISTKNLKEDIGFSNEKEQRWKE